MSGQLRFHRPVIAFALGPGVGLALSILAARWAFVQLRRGVPARGPVVLAPCLLLALFLGTLSGDRNYWWYMSSYLAYGDLASYTNLDPSGDKGQSFMDAGQVYFREGSTVSASDMMAFKSVSTFCVAPITSQPLWNAGDPDQIQAGGPVNMPPSGTVDFWAVGTDCCSPRAKSFNCSDASVPNARAGLRLLRDDQRPFYLLAVQAWVAKHCPLNDGTAQGRAMGAPLVCLPARHPLFFYWVEDPLREVEAYHAESKRLFEGQLFLFFVADVVLNVGLAWLLSNLASDAGSPP
eukprot:CAMPEP_0204534386 /NCGR_PEP_ID=MMETSP0661-20131031/12912_1 /ASSEMBLY_ACC=CAM_ASM_000606 /TAXON_ID=109239 /ORGANISM="Alexandrium margalefi, Strain AMGDE01CS-322" /LENGTH=292 /DNA_ID=CAMNT_0051540837 /DNA_START=93 /DNA_END=968 /DNA_ORIENTATION=-